jgi:hypothetical protein
MKLWMLERVAAGSLPRHFDDPIDIGTLVDLHNLGMVDAKFAAPSTSKDRYGQVLEALVISIAPAGQAALAGRKSF